MESIVNFRYILYCRLKSQGHIIPLYLHFCRILTGTYNKALNGKSKTTRKKSPICIIVLNQKSIFYFAIIAFTKDNKKTI